MSATKPSGIDPLADRILAKLAGRPPCCEIVLGGYLALQHHVAYRESRDLDAWWRGRASPAAEREILSVMRQIAEEDGFEVRERRFGETLSIELVRGPHKHFSFQIAVRSVTLEEPVVSAWPPVLIETLADTVGSKMNALVDRGAPRDFLDIRTVVDRGLLTIEGCWSLWGRKNVEQTVESAKQKVLVHLTALEMRRPLESIDSVPERERARTTREWFKGEFLHL
jgi:hypothetical protein